MVLRLKCQIISWRRRGDCTAERERDKETERQIDIEGYAQKGREGKNDYEINIFYKNLN